MAVFAYRGRSTSGTVSGQIEADDRPAAVAQLRARGIVATSVQERQAKAAAVKKVGGKVKDKDLAIYTRQFSTMVDAGLPIAQCLAILAEQGDSKALRDVTGKIAREVEGGATLAESFRKYPKVFNDLFTNMLQVGESGGVLDIVLQRLSGYIEKAAKLKAQVKGAMVYPVTIMGVAVLVIVFMMIFVIPTFAKMFQGLGADLPLPTKIVMLVSEFTQKYILFLIGAIAGTIYSIKRYYNTDQGSKVIDAFLLRVPVIGMLIRKVSVARFTRTLGTLIKSGVPIMQALETVAQTAGNVVIAEAVNNTRESIREGGHLSDPLKKSGIFPNMVTSMISVGEETGALDIMLSKIADFYDQEVDTAVKGLTSLIEPIVIVVMGVIIGTIVVAMFMPMFEIGGMAE